MRQDTGVMEQAGVEGRDRAKYYAKKYKEANDVRTEAAKHKESDIAA